MRLVRRSTMVALLGVALLAAGIGVVGLATALSTADSAPPEVIETPNSTSYVTPDAANVTRQEYAEASLDIGTAIVTDAERIQARHDELVVRDGEDSPARITVDMLEQRVETLERRHEEVLASYSRDEISTETLLTELARLEVAAAEYRETIARLQEDGDLSGALTNRVSVVSVEPTILDQPVIEQVATAKTTGEESVRVYVAATDDGLVAATVDRGRYVRQATLRDERNPFGDDQFAEGPEGRAQAASERGSSLYSVRANTVRGFEGTHVYEYRADHELGEAFAYLDGATTNPFHEHQYKEPVVSIPAQTSSSTGDAFRLNVQYTNATGPMAVSLVGANGDELTPIAISVEGQSVGTIQGSGELWTIQPLGEFTVTATADNGETVSVRVIP